MKYFYTILIVLGLTSIFLTPFQTGEGWQVASVSCGLLGLGVGIFGLYYNRKRAD